MKRALLSLVVILLVTSTAWAVPTLQLYIDGGTYDTDTQTWISYTNSFDLYVIGNGTLSDVLVSMALSTPEGTDPNGDVSVDIDGTPYGSWTYGYAPLSYVAADWDGGFDLPPHDIFPAWYTEFGAGDFGLVGGVGDVQPPTTWNPTMGYIPGGNAVGEFKKFTVNVNGDAFVHFDAYTLNEDGSIDQFAPFSHDAGTGIPEPATMLLFGLGLAGASVVRKLRK